MNPRLAKALTQSVAQFYREHGDAFSRTRQGAWAEEGLIHQLLTPGMTVVDVGAGNGRLAKHLPPGLKYVGFEPSLELRRAAKPLRLKVGELPHLPLASDMSDATVCLAVFHHLSNPALRKQSVKELIRITKPGGWIFASSWVFPVEKAEAIKDSLRDFWFPWKAEGVDAKRYVHLFDLKEWKELWSSPKLNIKEIGLIGKESWVKDLKDARNFFVIAQKKA